MNATNATNVMNTQLQRHARGSNRAQIVHATAFLGVALSAALSPALAHAQADTFPNRPIRFIVPFAPAGVSDIVARTIGARLQETLASR